VATPQAARKPRLPAWLSVPVIIGAILSMFVIVQIATNVPVAIVLGLVPIAIVGPVLVWLDRVEPEPWSARVHAFLWGAFVATAVSGAVNEIVGAGFGFGASLVISAPVIEEIMKAIGIGYAVRRKELDGVMDGVVYAGWTALGFAVVENFLYFGLAEQEGQLLLVFVLRALLTPFAHPLFTAWTGIAIGRAVARGAPLFPSALGGLALAILCHAAWNGAASYGAEISGLVVLGAAGMFVVLFLRCGHRTPQDASPRSGTVRAACPMACPAIRDGRTRGFALCRLGPDAAHPQIARQAAAEILRRRTRSARPPCAPT
jgi:RsiW-degrading membrane proteinase PrsW (M82 family)